MSEIKHFLERKKDGPVGWLLGREGARLMAGATSRVDILNLLLWPNVIALTAHCIEARTPRCRAHRGTWGRAI